MKDYSRLTKKELIDELNTVNGCYQSAHQERMASYFFLKSLSEEFYFVASTEIDFLHVDDKMKEGLRKMCEILEAVTPQGGF